MADDLPPDLAARYPSIANGGRPPARSVATPSKAPAPESQSTATAEERMAKRYPSIANGGKAVKVDRPTAGRGAPVESPAAATPDRKLTASEWQDREAERLAKRYPSLDTTAKEPTPESAGQAAEPALKARYPSIGEKSGQTVAELALDAPEGFDAADPHFVEFKKAAGELGLDKGKAGRLLELHRKVLAAQEQARDQEADGWRAQVEQDAEVMDNVETTRWLVREYGGREFTEALGPLGNHPVIVRALTRIAKDLDAARRRGTYL